MFEYELEINHNIFCLAYVTTQVKLNNEIIFKINDLRETLKFN